MLWENQAYIISKPPMCNFRLHCWLFLVRSSSWSLSGWSQTFFLKIFCCLCNSPGPQLDIIPNDLFFGSSGVWFYKGPLHWGCARIESYRGQKVPKMLLYIKSSPLASPGQWERGLFNVFDWKRERQQPLKRCWIALCWGRPCRDNEVALEKWNRRKLRVFILSWSGTRQAQKAS